MCVNVVLVFYIKSDVITSCTKLHLPWPEWLGGIMVGCRTYDEVVLSLTPGRVAVRWLILGWVTVYGQVNHLDFDLDLELCGLAFSSGSLNYSILRWILIGYWICISKNFCINPNN